MSLIKQWLGHSESLTDLYAAQLLHDMAYRREWYESAGLRFKWANCDTKDWSQSARHASRKRILRQLFEMVAGACNYPNCLMLPFRLELIRLAAWAACEVKGHRLAIACF